mmetsp:Transcript_26967/g.47714  ORF Transcript_26967/g.47714 Transcript_26967/m.47714 type:complete len:250 (-) Transcript_26967:317-1066(-)
MTKTPRASLLRNNEALRFSETMPRSPGQLSASKISKSRPSILETIDSASCWAPPEIASMSSMIIMQGDRLAASLKKFMSHSLGPTFAVKISGMLSSKLSNPLNEAMFLAKLVFPTPGCPCIMKRCGRRICIFLACRLRLCAIVVVRIRTISSYPGTTSDTCLAHFLRSVSVSPAERCRRNVRRVCKFENAATSPLTPSSPPRRTTDSTLRCSFLLNQSNGIEVLGTRGYPASSFRARFCIRLDFSNSGF